VRQARNKIIDGMKKKRKKSEFEHRGEKISEMQMLELNDIKLLRKAFN